MQALGQEIRSSLVEWTPSPEKRKSFVYTALVPLCQCDAKSRKGLFHLASASRKPIVPSIVTYRCMRNWQRLRVKPLGQRNPLIERR